MNLEDLKEITESKQFNPDNVLTIKEIREQYIQLVDYVGTNSFNTGYPIDDNIGGLRPTEVMTILGTTGSGKSILLQNILRNFTAQTEDLVLFISLEMSAGEIYERFAQMETGKAGFTIQREFQNREGVYNELDFMNEKYKNIVVYSRAITIQDIPTVIEKVEKFHNKKVMIVAVDHIMLVRDDIFKRDEYLAIGNIMRELKSFALNTGRCVLNISQVNRVDAKEGISLHSGKGSGEIENSSNYVITMHRITEKNVSKYEDYKISIGDVTRLRAEKKSIMLLRLEKNRRGDLCDTLLQFNHRSLIMERYQSLL